MPRGAHLRKRAAESIAEIGAVPSVLEDQLCGGPCSYGSDSAAERRGRRRSEKGLRHRRVSRSYSADTAWRIVLILCSRIAGAWSRVCEATLATSATSLSDTSAKLKCNDQCCPPSNLPVRHRNAVTQRD